MSKQDGSGRTVSAADVDDAGATILHADLDAFFASVELLDRPELRGKPVIVGHRSARSVVTAATYEARRYGVNSAMPMATALRRCRHAIVLEPHFDRYRHWSAVFFEVCRSTTPLVEVVGLDEGFLDVAGATRAVGTPKAAASLLRERVRAETGLVCSVGAAGSKFVAKLASSRAKPDGLLVIPVAETVAFLHPLPVSALWGVGGRTEERLRSRGISTVGDLAHAPEALLRRALGDASARHLHDLAWGIDARRVSVDREEKSIGHEVTFASDVASIEALRREALRISDELGARLRRAGVAARTVAIKVRWEDFTTVTRSATLADPTDSGRELYRTALGLLDALVGRDGEAMRPVRLFGVRGEQLTSRAPSALWDDGAGWRDTEDVIDAARERFGRAAIRPASLLGGAGGTDRRDSRDRRRLED